MLFNLFDSHAHYDDDQYDGDRDTLLEALPGMGVRYVMTAATDLASAEKVVAMAERYPYIYAAVGIHPHEADGSPADMEDQLRVLADHPRVRAIGEIGLDYHYDFSERGVQREVFERQLALAGELGLPVIIHDREAHADTLELIRRYRPKGILHCYSGSAEMAGELVGMGMYLGFTGAVTFKGAKEWRRVQTEVPLDRLLIETDCPYLAPAPLRGKRCDSTMLPYTVAAIAEERGIEPQVLANATCYNAMRVFGIDTCERTAKR